MNIRIVADNVKEIKDVLKKLSEQETLSSNCHVSIIEGAEYDYEFVRSDCIFSNDSRKKVVNPNERSH